MALHAPLPLRDGTRIGRGLGRAGRGGRTRPIGNTAPRRPGGRPQPAPGAGAAESGWQRPGTPAFPQQGVLTDPRRAEPGVVTARGVAAFAVVVVAATVLVAGAALLTGDVTAAAGPQGPNAGMSEGSAPATVVIEPGGSMWGVAVRYAPEDSDLRAYVAELERLNGVPAGDVHPGTVLRLPGQ
jgi:hypothetical protein